MAVRQNTPFLYRFDIPVDSVYGPRALDWILECYGARPECECAPASEDGTTPLGPWRPVREWRAEMLPAGVTDLQLKRLANLHVQYDPQSLTRDEAKRLIAKAEGQQQPTKVQLANAAELKLAVPDGSTRAQVVRLLDAEKRRIAIASLGERGRNVADGASWENIRRAESAAETAEQAREIAADLRQRGVAISDDTTLDHALDAQYALRDFESALADARALGLDYEPPTPLPVAKMKHLVEALWTFREAQSIGGTDLEWLVRLRKVPREPRPDQIRAVLPDLFARIVAGRWKGTEDDQAWLCRRALGASD